MTAARMALAASVLAAAALAGVPATDDTAAPRGMFNAAAVLDATQVQDRRNEPAGPDLPGWFCVAYGDVDAPSWACAPPAHR